MADQTSSDRDLAPTTDASPGESTASGPGVYRYRVRRAPNIWAFIVTGAFLGAIVGVVIDYAGPNGCARVAEQGCTAPYDPGVSLAYLLVLGALAGIAVAATLAVLLDRLLDR